MTLGELRQCTHCKGYYPLTYVVGIDDRQTGKDSLERWCLGCYYCCRYGAPRWPGEEPVWKVYESPEAYAKRVVAAEFQKAEREQEKEVDNG